MDKYLKYAFNRKIASRTKKGFRVKDFSFEVGIGTGKKLLRQRLRNSELSTFAHNMCSKLICRVKLLGVK